MNPLQSILAKYCLEIRKGLLLLSMPTGFGKTYNVLEFIYQNYQQFKEDNRKIIFLTNLKKNLPHEDLKQRFVQDDQEKEYDNHVLFIDSNFDCIINNLLSVQNEINDNYKNSKNYGKLIENIKIFKNLPNIESDYRKFIKKEIEKYESQFRKSIQKSLENIKPKQDRIKAIKNDPEYQWIGKLYPAVFTDEKTVLFMSIDKFCLKNSTLVEPSYFCYKQLAKNALIFMDEFDSTKSAILNQIISEKVSKKKDLINLFLNIHNHLQNTEFPTFLLKESQRRKKISNQNNKIILLSQIVEELRKKSQKIFEDFSLQYNYKYQSNNEEKPKRNFLFYDYQTHHVLDRSSNLIICKDEENKINQIKTVEYKDFNKYKQDRLSTLTGRMIGFINYFQRGISFLAENYQNLKKEEENIIFSLESAISTVLSNFKLEPETIKFLSDNIQQNYQSFQNEEDKSINQLKSFYEIGFKYYDVVDDDNHDLNSKIYFYNYNRTPEIILEEVCKKAMVIGISATAHMDTNIGNYDLDYLRNSLKNSFYYLSEDEINQLRNEYEKITKGYDKVTIKTKFTDTEESEDEALETLIKIVDDETCANNLLNKCEKKYIFCRYVRMIEAWHYFNKNEDCRAFICFLNKLPKFQDKKLDLDILHEYFCYANNIDYNNPNQRNDINLIKDIILVVNSNNFDDKFKEFKDKLQQGKRVFIISTYQTLGAGVNLQYPISNDYQTIKINDFESREEMDINGVYLEKPTNLLTPLNSDDVKDEDFIKHLFQLEFLRENSALSVQQFKNKLDKAFHYYIGDKGFKGKEKIDLYQSTAYIKYVNKVIIQALGRICRTNIKAPVIHILAHKSLKKYLDGDILPVEIIPVKEYQELTKHCIKFDQKNMLNKQKLEAKIKAENISNQSWCYIQSRLNGIWNDNYIEDWQSLREQVLRQPTIISQENFDQKWRYIYVKLPESKNYYRFTQTGDYQNVEIFFEKSEGDYEVSEKASRLPKLMKIAGLKQHFIDNNWATEFPQSELIITPPVFNNIYRGALGEVSGKYILENYLNDINLLPLEEKEYERFDFKTQNGIYIDFKFWGGSFDKDEETELNKIRAKMNQINAEKVIIINILAHDNKTAFKPTISDDDKIIRIPFLCQNNQVNPRVLQYISDKINKI
ncbi:MAG: hypothetical protein IGQ45_13600 [Cyanobacterium sp. T60_A2020_053]|nr:hypothetical protein [Cyanobacterium sp. T60_A2020_053]